MLNSYEGDRSKLGGAEKFIIALIQTPAYQFRIDGMLLKIEFEASRTSLLSDVAALKAACDAIINSTSLLEFLNVVLHMGNFINAVRMKMMITIIKSYIS